ncbi:hypothetical protein P154DRAFT_51158 [Amniculicola lignicola CBS 123094]|uniref:Uncharacterized protein n=1 Tax=Amniculicola lignicola CBS 123094 TaxID=1392246 RepID=A0A6A5WQQ7_9PLEO|nr:hypothetical protein P154DRAFT_51158 [Amniculicola lignicola CBS 123094]
MLNTIKLGSQTQLRQLSASVQSEVHTSAGRSVCSASLANLSAAALQSARILHVPPAPRRKMNVREPITILGHLGAFHVAATGLAPQILWLRFSLWGRHGAGIAVFHGEAGNNMHGNGNSSAYGVLCIG